MISDNRFAHTEGMMVRVVRGNEFGDASLCYYILYRLFNFLKR